jgi:hypothetical protein
MLTGGRSFLVLGSAALLLAAGTLEDGMGSVKAGDPLEPGQSNVQRLHQEVPNDPQLPAPAWRPVWPPLSPPTFARDGYYSVQVNVDEFGGNIPGDAANEPSIAVDPSNPNQMTIGWRQFDTVESDFRQAGWGYSRDAGRTWTFPGSLDPGVFRSDPVLDTDTDGNFYYYSLQYVDDEFFCDLFKSSDGGQTWLGPIYAYGGDKAWFDIDMTGGIGHGNFYAAWDHAGCCGDNWFTRSTDGGDTFDYPVPIPERPIWGVTTVGPDGAVYVAGRRRHTNTEFVVAKSSTAQDPNAPLAFDLAVEVDLGGSLLYNLQYGPNPGGLLGQVWIATDHSDGSTHGNIYVLASVEPPEGDPLDVHFIRSTDGGLTWSAPVRVNDDPPGTAAWQWFGTLAVAPNGRIDVVWNDTRNSGSDNVSELFYSYSTDAGLTWSPNVALSEPFDSWLGWPNQEKLGDYYDMVSDDVGVNLAYAATFNGEQDVYFLRIGDFDCNGNGVADTDDIDGGFSDDVNGNGIPDECECFGDLDGDNDTDQDDLGILLTDWGCAGGDCPGDIDGDGDTDHSDLGALLADWGCIAAP